jgi:hypothetical protein
MKRNPGITIPDNVVKMYKEDMYNCGFPSDDISPAEKDKHWCRQFTRAVLQQHFLGFTVFPYANMGRMLELRDYMNGKQSVDRYYPRIFGKKACEDKGVLEQRIGMYRSTWKIQSIIPQMVAYVKSKLDEMDYSIVAKSINPLVNDMQEEKEYRMLANGILPKESFAELEAMGLKIPEETIISSIEEMNLFKELGGLKPAEEFVAQMLIEYTLKNGDWKFIRDLLAEDVICYNKAIVKDTFDPFSGKAEPEYVDPVNFVGLIDNKSTESDFCYAGHIKMMSIKTIRSILRQKGCYTDETEGQLRQTSIMYNNFYSNRFDGNTSSDEYRIVRNGLYVYDMFHVPVIDLSYKTIDTEKRRYRENEKGEKKYLRCSYDEDGPDIVTSSKEYFYKSLMVLGSELMVEWGRESNQNRVGLSKAKSSFHMVSSPNPSIVERSIPIADDFAFDYIKFQHESAVAAPNAIAIAKSSLQNNTQNGNNMTEGQALDMMLTSGKILYEDFQIIGNSMMNSSVPVKEIPGGMGKVLEEYITKVNLNLMLAREILNIRQTDAAPRLAVQVAQLAESQTDRAIAGPANLLKRLSEQLAEGCYNKIKQAVKYNKNIYNGYYPIVGKTSLDVIKLTADIDSADMGFVFVQRPPSFEVQADLDRLSRLAEPTASGLPPIEASTFYAIRSALLNGMTEVARVYMIRAEAKRNEIAQKIADRNQMIQTQVQQSMEAAKTQREQAIIWAKVEAENWLAEQEFVREQKRLSLQPIEQTQTQAA